MCNSFNKMYTTADSSEYESNYNVHSRIFFFLVGGGGRLKLFRGTRLSPHTLALLYTLLIQLPKLVLYNYMYLF